MIQSICGFISILFFSIGLLVVTFVFILTIFKKTSSLFIKFSALLTLFLMLTGIYLTIRASNMYDGAQGMIFTVIGFIGTTLILLFKDCKIKPKKE